MRIRSWIAPAFLGLALLALPPASPAFADDEEVFKIGGGVSPPSVVKKVEPEYTPEAKAARIEGGVLLEIVVTKEGKVLISSARAGQLKNKDTGVPSELDYGLTEKAKQAVEQWQFRPGYKAGRAVNVRANVEVNFRLE